MTFYERNAQTALRQITKYGRDILLARPNSTFDPVTGEVTAASSTQQTLKGITVEPKNATKYIEAGYENDLIADLNTGKIRCVLMAAVGATFEPIANDLASFDDLTWKILGCNVVAPGGVKLLYLIFVISNGETLPPPATGDWDGTWDNSDNSWDDSDPDE